MKHIYHFLQSHLVLFTFLISGLIGVGVFLLIYGSSVIDPTNIAWLQSSNNDLSQHYIGWLFYRQDEWTFPFGAIQSLAYPHGIALTFMDSIPLFAIPFKLFSPVLPDTFQYFGLWGIASHFLQGGIAGLIILRLTKRFGIAVIGSVFFSLSPIMLDRMFAHTALAGHWIILVAILLSLYCKTMSLKKFIGCWSLVLSVAACIHPYFLPMVAALLAIAAVIGFKQVWELFLRLMIPVGVAVAVFWVIGGLLVKNVATSELGMFGTNLNALFNSGGWSSMFMPLPSTRWGYEGFAYLGAGAILLGFMVVYKIFTMENKVVLARYVKRFMTARWLWVYVVLLLLLIAAIGPTINYGDQQFVINLPDIVEKIWSVFRATGRLFWPIYYVVLIVLIVSFYRLSIAKSNYKYVLGFLLVTLTIQVYDIGASAMIKLKHNTFASAATQRYTSQLDTTKWVQLAADRRHLQYIGRARHDTFFSIAFLANRYNLTMSDGYFARAPYAKIEQTSKDASRSVLGGKARADTLYVTRDATTIAYVKQSKHLVWFQDAGLTIFAVK